MESYNGILCTKADALYLIQAAKKNMVPLVTQRFSSYERQTYIKSGSVFVWCENKSSIKRWTDGRKWSASRVSGVFLSYKEMKPAKSSTCHIIDEKDDGLLKQSFSYTMGGEKYHIINYIASEINNDHTKLSTYQRPSLDVRFADFQIDDMLQEESESPAPQKRKSMSDYSEDEESDSSDASSFSHVSKKRHTSLDSALYTTRNSSLSSVSSIPSSPSSPLPSITLTSYTSKPIILPPLQNIMPMLLNTNTNSGPQNKCDFDRDALLSLKCSFSN